ncbi:MAG: Wzz/FepE/Etk N-terminal domain-containing protein, partial [Cytophagales bacterium]|nr:Wzz/FepE/Etk N-terminal domain-containing protein [Cytophagales bacterium]
MNDFQNIKRLLIPLFRGSPIVVGCFLLALVLGYRSVLYTNPVYESTAKMRLDDVDNGVSSTNLFKDFDVFAHTNKIAAEVEVLKSRLLTEKTLEQLDFGISYYRIGKIRTTELYHNSPFWVQFHSDSTALADRDIRLEIISDQSFKVFQSMSEDSEFITGDFGQKITFKGVRLSIVKNETLIQNKPGLHLVDQ